MCVEGGTPPPVYVGVRLRRYASEYCGLNIILILNRSEA